MELIRSLIFVPGNRPNMPERARSFDADVISERYQCLLISPG
jgi:hypothetical protein